MKMRILAGVPAAFLTVALVLWGPDSLQLGVILVLSGLGYLEFDRLMFEQKRLSRTAKMVSLVALCVWGMSQQSLLGFHIFTASVVLLLVVRIVRLGEGKFESAVKEMSLELLGLVYCLLLFGFLYEIVNWPETGRAYLLFLFLVVFFGDTAAYFGGLKFGKHKLAERISPKKTIEGAVSAGIGSILVFVLWIKFIYPLEVSSRLFCGLLVVTLVLSALAQLGDLFESVLKRSQSQKDSGTFLPGHGGLLDRLDGLAFSAPALALFLTYFMESVS